MKSVFSVSLQGFFMILIAGVFQRFSGISFTGLAGKTSLGFMATVLRYIVISTILIKVLEKSGDIAKGVFGGR